MKQRVVEKYERKVGFLVIKEVNWPPKSQLFWKYALLYKQGKQGSVSLVKSSEKAMYLEFVVLGQIMPAANIDPAINLDTHAFKENEVLMYTPVYNKSTALYGGLT